ncbi:DUF4124 domain-containing protein [Curvibacter sp. APW13]|uniref:DUF4124 domain-containing protein n=1 Tax=Curvibacter sp. APW13 TaxID=3077236 RepID=UPI0028DFC558|nr:DUF4124 domain-containing protein [Curvibacter sp. APW13]MDT8990200.1 DUF4124 domain-containing protein [Curvibacter sp. APW13]
MQLAHRTCVTALTLAIAGVAAAQGTTGPVIPGVYTCVDAKGRKLTSDRPILECIDREQKVLNPSGTVKAKVGPSLTAQERAELEQKTKREAEEQAKAADEKRRNRALLARYPNKATHDKERNEAITGVETVIKAAKGRIDELASQQSRLDQEMEFYKKDPAKAPLYLRRQVEETQQSMAVQKRFIGEQEAEIRRINSRFDEELTRLKPLWAAGQQ